MLERLLLSLIATTWTLTVHADESNDFFEKKIRPVLVDQCYRCHSETKGKVRGGLALDSREGMRQGGDTGPAIIPGKLDKSLLLKALHYDGDTRMPPEGKLSDKTIRDFETWIKQGAIDPRISIKPTVQKEPARSDFWAFQNPMQHPAPKVKNPNWIRNKIDAFTLASMQQQGLHPAEETDRRTFIRRATFDVIGLPPTPKEVEAFVNDKSTSAYASLIDRLLATPQYGERWARPWLDVARYAEDQAHIVGDKRELFYPNAYLYRDWVIAALNRDLPYDEFVKLQLAADLIEGNDGKNIPALGFIGLGPKYYQRKSPEVQAEEWEDRVDVVSRGLQGLTVACARCHDHKFDPIPTEDYYALAGVFASTEMFNRPLKGDATQEAKNPEEAMHIIRDSKPIDLPVFIRGNVENKGEVTQRHLPRVLTDSTVSVYSEGSGRKQLANDIASRDNPLTARVIVNRIWAGYFDHGIVGTPSNFGQLGDRPTHPELLDDLAVRFMQNGWSLKWLHREILLSATYRQSSTNDQSSDPDNRWLSRMPRRRLPIESWRDSILAVAGTLDTAKVGGKSIDPLDPKATRRTVYSRISRLDLNRLLALFDFPDPNATSEKRVLTTTPLQNLFVLNSPFMIEQSQALAKHVQGDDRIEKLYALLFARSPTTEEVALAKAYLKQGAWNAYVHALLASNEMMYID